MSHLALRTHFAVSTSISNFVYIAFVRFLAREFKGLRVWDGEPARRFSLGVSKHKDAPGRVRWVERKDTAARCRPCSGCVPRVIRVQLRVFLAAYRFTTRRESDYESATINGIHSTPALWLQPRLVPRAILSASLRRRELRMFSMSSFKNAWVTPTRRLCQFLADDISILVRYLLLFHLFHLIVLTA